MIDILDIDTEIIQKAYHNQMMQVVILVHCRRKECGKCNNTLNELCGPITCEKPLNYSERQSNVEEREVKEQVQYGCMMYVIDHHAHTPNTHKLSYNIDKYTDE